MFMPETGSYYYYYYYLFDQYKVQQTSYNSTRQNINGKKKTIIKKQEVRKINTELNKGISKVKLN